MRRLLFLALTACGPKTVTFEVPAGTRGATVYVKGSAVTDQTKLTVHAPGSVTPASVDVSQPAAPKGSTHFSLTTPNADVAAGTWTVEGGDVTTEVIRSTAPATGTLTFDLRFVLVTGCHADETLTRTHLQRAAMAIDNILIIADVRIGDVTFDSVSTPVTCRLLDGWAELSKLVTRSAREVVMLVTDADIGEGPYIGQATLPASFGVEGSEYGIAAVSVPDPLNMATGNTAATLAHEIGHLVGLHHNVEQDGTNDALGDTAACSGGSTRADCPIEAWGNLMFWSSEGGRLLSASQIDLLRRSTLFRAQ